MELNSGGIIDGGCQHDKKSAVRIIVVNAVIHLSLLHSFRDLFPGGNC